MLFMVIERFKNAAAVGERFKACGRMLPEGIVYQASWMEETGARCFQIMDAVSLAASQVWIARWDDLVEFEIVPVLTSAEFWERFERGG
jgi:hypothetical protein